MGQWHTILDAPSTTIEKSKQVFKYLSERTTEYSVVVVIFVFPSHAENKFKKLNLCLFKYISNDYPIRT